MLAVRRLYPRNRNATRDISFCKSRSRKMSGILRNILSLARESVEQVRVLFFNLRFVSLSPS